jgi:Methyltransferase FkbM domain
MTDEEVYSPSCGINDSGSLRVQAVAVDEYVESGTIRLPDLVKVDVEGHGVEAIRRAIRSIKQSRPVIAFSSHSSEEARGVRKLLEPLGYSPQGVDWENIQRFAILLPRDRSAESGDLVHLVR